MESRDASVGTKNSSHFGIRHLQILLLFLNLTCIYMSRLNISVAVVAMTHASTTNPDFTEFNWTEKEKNYIISSFYWGYILLQFPASYLNRHFGAKNLLLICTFLSALFCLLTPYLVNIGSWPAYCAIRVIQGLLQGAIFPSINDHIAKWSPTKERYFLGALTYSGVNCGTVCAMLLSGLIASSSLGWPGISYVSGGLCLFWCVLWLILASRNPSSSPLITKEECQYIEASLNRQDNFVNVRTTIPWKAMLTSVPFLALILARWAEMWGFSTLQSQIPSYMNGVLNMNIKSNALYSCLPYIARWFMCYVYTFVGMTAARRGWLELTAIRKISNTLSTWIPACLLIGIGFLDGGSKVLAISLLVVSVGFEAGSVTGCVLSTIDLAPNYADIVMGITNTLASVIPLVSPLIVGAIVTDVHSRTEWQIVFGISAVIAFFCNFVYIIFGSSEAQPWNAADFSQKHTTAESVHSVVPKGTLQEIFGSTKASTEFIKVQSNFGIGAESNVVNKNS